MVRESTWGYIGQSRLSDARAPALSKPRRRRGSSSKLSLDTYQTRANGAAQRNATLVSRPARIVGFMFPIGAASMLAGWACSKICATIHLDFLRIRTQVVEKCRRPWPKRAVEVEEEQLECLVDDRLVLFVLARSRAEMCTCDKAIHRV